MAFLVLETAARSFGNEHNIKETGECDNNICERFAFDNDAIVATFSEAIILNAKISGSFNERSGKLISKSHV